MKVVKNGSRATEGILKLQGKGGKAKNYTWTATSLMVRWPGEKLPGGQRDSEPQFNIQAGCVLVTSIILKKMLYLRDADINSLCTVNASIFYSHIVCKMVCQVFSSQHVRLW